MWIEDLANYVRAANVAGIGQNVFVFTLRADEVGCMLTTHTQGLTNYPELPGYWKGTLQSIVRSNSAQSALNQAQAISDLLDSNQARIAGEPMELALDTATFHYLLPRNLPVVFPRSDGDFFEASVNFDVCFVNVS